MIKDISLFKMNRQDEECFTLRLERSIHAMVPTSPLNQWKAYDAAYPVDDSSEKADAEYYYPGEVAIFVSIL